MYDYPQQIEAFIAENFTVSNPEEANVKMSNADLLSFLFKVFPEGCINDYELNDIMKKLGYTRHTYTIVNEGQYEIESGWCLKSELELGKVEDKPKS